MIETRFIIVEHTHTQYVKNVKKHFMTRVIVKLSAVKPDINTSSKRLAVRAVKQPLTLSFAATAVAAIEL